MTTTTTVIKPAKRATYYSSRLTPEQKKQWIADLLNGEVEQCYSMLRCGGARCSLGVLADRLPADCEKGEASYSEVSTVIPQHLETKLIALNDGQQRTFPQIAAFIRQYVRTIPSKKGS